MFIGGFVVGSLRIVIISWLIVGIRINVKGSI